MVEELGVHHSRTLWLPGTRTHPSACMGTPAARTDPCFIPSLHSCIHCPHHTPFALRQHLGLVSFLPAGMTHIFTPQRCVLLWPVLQFPTDVNEWTWKHCGSSPPNPDTISLFFFSALSPISLQNTQMGVVRGVPVVGERLDQTIFHAPSRQNVQSVKHKQMVTILH